MRPANSAPGENGNSGLYWYFPAMISRSKKLSATASTRTTACPGPATGSGRSPMVRSSGVPARVQSRAFMARGSRFYMGSRRPSRPVQSRRGGGCDNSFFPLQILPFFSLYLQTIDASVRHARGPMRLTPNRLALPLLAAGTVLALPSLALAQAKPPANPTAQATLLGQYGDWGAYTASPGGQKVCFALAKPTSSVDNPPNRRTAANPVYMFISTRPTEKVSNEVSVLVTGYVFKPNSEASVAVGGANFPMYTQNDGAWVKNAAEEAKLLDTMRKGADVVIKATTSRGTQTTDTFSLKGIGQAVDRASQECK